MTPSEKEILYLALAEPIGLLLRTNDPGRCRQRLYQARTGDPSLSELQFRICCFEDGNLLVVNRSVEVLAKI